MADDGRDAATASRKRPSLAMEEGEGMRRGSGSSGASAGGDALGEGEMRSNSASSRRPTKRPRTDAGSGSGSGGVDDDPYAFPDDDEGFSGSGGGAFTKAQPKPVSALPQAAPSSAPQTTTSSLPPPAQEDSSMTSPPARADADTKGDSKAGVGVGADAGTDADADADARLQDAAQREERKDDAPADTVMGGTGEDERPSTGEKKPPPSELPESSAAQSEAAAPSAVPQIALPPHVKLREPHKLKRLREQHDRQREADEQRAQPPSAVSEEEMARQGLRRALVLALDHVGFAGSSDEALESFLLMTETYFHSLAEDVARFARTARRNQPIPVDFDTSLARFNLSTGLLRPHLRNPIAPEKRTPPALAEATAPFAPPWSSLGGSRASDGDLPLLSRELSGRPEKESKTYIPRGFPDFPSIHTYRNTPVDVDTVTVRGSGLRYDDGSLLVVPGEEPGSSGGGGSYAPLLDGTHRGSGAARDPKRIREAAAVEAKQAEEALRGLMRASKIHKLKEVRAAAERNELSKQRYVLWETAMRELISEAKEQEKMRQQRQRRRRQKKHDGAGAAATAAGSSSHDADGGAVAALRDEIADQSMMVNAEKVYHRRETPRKAGKAV